MMNNSKSKITLVEDDLSIATLYNYKLAAAGYLVSLAKNGIEGLEVIEKERPDLVLLDLMMPEMDGETMLEHLRKHEWSEHIKVIILTNLSRSEAPVGLINLSVDHYIVKAMYTPRQILEIVEKVLAS